MTARAPVAEPGNGGGLAPIDPNKVAAYVRWSTDEQGNGTTLAIQTEACKLFIQSQGWHFRDDLLFVDDGYSGGTLERPALKRLRELIQAGEVQCVVVFKLDRLSRSVVDTVNLVLKEWEGKCYIKSTREPIDTTHPAGKMFFYMLAGYAEFERSLIKERTLGGKYRRASEGRNAGFSYPYGYRRGADGKHELDGWDEANRCFTGKAAVVRRIFTEYLSGLGCPKIVDGLRADGIPTPSGKGTWRLSTVYGILNNPVYTGTYIYGKRKKGDRRFATMDPKWKIEDAFAPIVTREEFEQVQALMQRRRAENPRALASDFLLTGIARCARCGAALSGTRNGTGRRYYLCANYANRLCRTGVIDADRLEQAVVARVTALLAPDSLTLQAALIEREIRQTVAEKEHTVCALQARISGLEQQLQKAEVEWRQGELSARLYSRLAEKLEGELQAAWGQLRKAQQELQAARERAVNVERCPAVGPIEPWAGLTVPERKELLRHLISSLTVVQDPKPKGAGSGLRNPNPIRVHLSPRVDPGERPAGWR